MAPHGEIYEPSFERIRHAMWLAEGLGNDETAEMFEAALPAELRGPPTASPSLT